MGSTFFSVFVILGGLASVLASSTGLDLPDDPSTAPDCTRWWDNDGSILCSEIPAVWGIALEDFLRWNPSLSDTCDNFLPDQSYCVEAFGEPEPTHEAMTTAGPTPTLPGETRGCNRWDLVKPGDTCDTFIQKYPGLTREDLVQWNPEIGPQCQFLWVGYYICTEATSSSTTPPVNGIPTPTPIQPGMVENCDKFHLVESGDDCASIAWTYGLSRDHQFLQYNPQVRADGSGLWQGYYVCVGIIGESPIITATPTTSSNGIATPTPTHPGMVGNCDIFYRVQSGDTCAEITQQYGITVAQLSRWNPKIGTHCNGLCVGCYLCVGIMRVYPTHTATTTTTPATTGSTNGITTPTPTQPGMADDCNRFQRVIGGNTCQSIANQAGITMARFYTWNKGVGSNCQRLRLGYYVCIGVL
ncbi:hypothetical protein BJX61DRAFT_537453 [Aspergillus egyptiacus]|nr:hypothetical protein BJX61DRAFT_537453 [Aspergillus egyptiacus]